ncbi:MAG: carbohydrate binding family 9 domain-containing protein [Balneola sp.]
MLRKFVLFLTTLFFGSTYSIAQDAIKIKRTTTPIIVDGFIDEPAWESVEPFPMVQYEPVFKGELSERTEVRVLYDDEFLYVSAKMFTEDPSTIAANSLYRDKYSGDDVFAIVLDPFNDDQNGLRFFTTPAGVRFDQSISNDANNIGGNNPVNGSWNTFWDAESTINGEGWFSEMRIPFSSIGFQSSDGVAEMGMILYRWLSHHNERHIYPEIPPNWDEGKIKPSQAQDIIITGAGSKKPVYFTPYGLAGVSRFNEINSDSSAYYYNDDIKAELGFDLKYNVTSNLTLDVTVNTDFAQVEADDQQLNLTRFSLSFDEKRQFFQQRSGLFDFNYGNTKVFYSRRIGLDNSGNPVRILGGVRLTGKVNDLDVGFINLQTGESDNLVSENFNVLRLKKSVINPSSFVGGIFTSRIGVNGNTNMVLGVDGDINIFGDDYIEARISQTYDSSTPEANRHSFEDNSIFRISWQRRASVGWYYRFFVNRTGSEFNPGIGFIRAVNTSDYFYRLGYGWLAEENSIFKQHSVNIGSYSIQENKTFDLRSRFISMEWQTDFKTLGTIEAEAKLNQEYLLPNEDFDLVGKIYIPVDDYDFFEGKISYRSPNSKRIRTNFGIEYGDFFDGKRTQFVFEPKIIANIHFEIGGKYQITKLNFPNAPGRDVEDFTAHLAQLKAQYALNKKLSTSAFIQYGNIAELAGVNVRFRYNFSEGRDFWIVFNEQSYTMRDQRDIGLPRLPTLQSGSILIKYNHTFIY